MVGTTCSPSYFKGNSGISYPIYIKTSAEETEQPKQLPSGLLFRNADGGAEDGSAGCDRTRFTGPRLRVSSVSGEEVRRLPSTCAQSKSTQQFPGFWEIPACQHVQGTIFSPTQRLDDEDRLEPGILPRASSRIASPVPEVCSTMRTSLQVSRGSSPTLCMANDQPTVWPSKCTQNLRHSLELGGTAVKAQRDEGSGIPGRLPFGKPVPPPATGPCSSSQSPATRAGLGNKQREVVGTTSSEYRISRYRMEHGTEHQVITTREALQTTGLPREVSGCTCLVTARSAEAGGLAKLCQFHSSVRQNQLPQPVDTDAEGGPRRDFSGPHCPGSCRPSVVDEPLQRGERNLASTSHALHSDRRIRRRLGSVRGWPLPAGSMAGTRNFVPSQQEGIASHIICSPEHGPGIRRQNYTGSERQSDGAGLSAQPGGHPLRAIVKYSKEHLHPLNDPSHSSDDELHSRPAQLCSGQSVEVQSTPRVASSSNSDQIDISQVGNTNNRSICFTERSRSSPICNARPERSSSRLPRCLQQNLDLQAGVDIPATVPDASGVVRDEPSARQVHSDLSSVAECVLEGGPKSKGTMSTLHDSQPAQSVEGHYHRSTSSTGRPPSIRGMADSGWDELLHDWSPSQRSLVESSWRPSTLRTYKQCWLRWSSWCRSSNVNLKDPGPGGIAKYLVYLHKTLHLSYRTILVHKSVVTNFCRPQDTAILSSHTLVRQVLKGIANETCAKTKVNKPPIWNPQLVIDWLVHNDPISDNLFDISRRCAILLLLASGRRVHDLTLLSVAPDHMEDHDGRITFWPKYGSKTDCLARRQSGWELSSGPHANIDLVRWLRRLVELSAPRRAQAETSSLFVTTCGAPRAASRTVIGGWVRTVLSEAGIHDAPGSTRSAVASLSWVQNFPVEDILARGNWTSQNTLLRYYKRPLARSTSDTASAMTNCFKPV